MGHNREHLRDAAELASARFKVLSDPTRLAILGRILRTPSTVTDLAMYFELAQPTVSAHVKMLRDADLLESERNGASTTYRTTQARLDQFVGGAVEGMRPADGECVS